MTTSAILSRALHDFRACPTSADVKAWLPPEPDDDPSRTGSARGDGPACLRHALQRSERPATLSSVHVNAFKPAMVSRKQRKRVTKGRPSPRLRSRAYTRVVIY